MEKFKGKYRIESARLQNWDYGWNAQYFVTICTKNREQFFGEIDNGQMILSEIGKLSEKYWFEIPEHFPFVKLDAFVVMPNHIHGIIEINKNDGDINGRDGGGRDGDGRDGDGRDGDGRDGDGRDGDGRDGDDGRDAINRVSTTNTTNTANTANTLISLNTDKPQNQLGGITGNKNPMISENLSKIIRWYKGRCAFESHKINVDFGWQSRFHDHIIRNDGEYQRIKNYIINNPVKWNDDKFNA